MSDGTLVDLPDVFLHQKGWETSFLGYRILGCAVRDRNFVYLALVEDPPGEHCGELRNFRMVALYLNENDAAEQWGHQGLNDFHSPMISACTIPYGQGLFVSSTGDTYASGSKKSAMEQIGDASNPPGIRKVRCIAGRAYAAAVGQEIFRRADIGVWNALSREGLPENRSKQLLSAFNDVDGFTESNLYAVGEKGNVWHFDGKRWRSCKFPGEQDLFGICCAGDGNVYVCGQDDLVYVLSKGTWSKIHEGSGNTLYPLTDMRWFDDKLWLVGDFKTKNIIKGELVDASHNGNDIRANFIDAADGVLLLATSGGTVMLFDGKVFRYLVVPYQ